MMTRATLFRRLGLALLVIGFFSATTHAQPKSKHVKARLVADVAAVKPGATFTVGVLFEIEPEWHIYWTNPGDSGSPTTVKITVPEGFKVGEVRYPVPERFEQPADVVGFGYHDSVLLTADVQAPAELSDASEVKIEADAKWLSCSHVCIPGKAKLELSLPVSTTAGNSDDTALFKQWAPRVPRDVSDDKEVAEMKWHADADQSVAILTVTWSAGEVRGFDVFPGADPALTFGKPTYKNHGSQTTVTVPIRVFEGQAPGTASIPAVFAYTEKEGQRRGVVTEIPLPTRGADPKPSDEKPSN